MSSLVRLSTTEKSGQIRDIPIVGEETAPPTVGKSFAIMGAPVVEWANARLVMTSKVVSVEKTEKGYTFETESGSKYELTE